MFSARVPHERRPNRLSAALSHAKATRGLLDLTLSNPTRAGIRYPSLLLAPLAQSGGLTYCPEPFGLLDARQAIAECYARRGVRVAPAQIVLTASTSEAYSLLFKLLCDPARTNVLTPAPSYPLFDHLTSLDGVEQRRYVLEYHGTWSIDAHEVDRQWTDQTSAVLAVSPNNPTGSCLTAAEAALLTDRCATRHAALIVDEVFIDYPLEDPILEPPAFESPTCLMFRLGGLSKSAGLPQLKLGWMTVEGPPALVAEALDRLELICDTYLSVATPVQLAARSLLDDSAIVRDQIRARIRTNLSRLRAVVRSGSGAVTLIEPQGGWSAVIRVPAHDGEEALVLELLERDDVIVHPGFFFDFPREAYLVISLLPEVATFETGVQRILERLHAA